MKKSILFFLLALLPMLASAYDAYIGGIYYNLNPETKKAIVTYKNQNYNSYSGTVVIPSSVTYNGNEYSVTSIDASAFFKSSGLTSVNIPNSVTSIGGFAFAYCIGLTSVTIPNSMTSIGSGAFAECTGLTEVQFNATNCTTMGIDKYPVFKGCTSITTLTIGNNVQNIPDYAFSGCSILTKVIVPDIAAWCRISFGSDAFNYNKLHIYSDADTEIIDLVIPNSVNTISSSAFRLCTWLTSVTIGNSVTSIGEGAFSGCSGLKSISIPNSVISIGSGAFYECTGLTNVIIPNSVNSVGIRAFQNCTGLTSVTIGNSVNSVGDRAFSNCTGIKFIYSKNVVPPTCASTATFADDIYKYAYLYVPQQSLQQYKTAYEWRNFVNIIGQDYEDEDNLYKMEVVLKNGTSTTYDLNDVKEVNIIKK